jgi:SpoVK/Ycf46/Vps4 family AAA+-type ATPase
MEVLNIPIKQRVYVIEDIDAMESVVVKRTAEQLKKEEDKKLKVAAEVEILRQTQGIDAANRMVNGKDADTDKLDLATLLNVLDGVRETPGRIIVLSTNYPERLDEALLRPGRFDMMIEFEKHNCEVLKQHIEKYYGVGLTKQQWNRINSHALHHKWTPAEVSQILFRRIQSIDLAIDDLVNENPAKLFKFSQLTKEGPKEQKEESTDLTKLFQLENTEEDETTELTKLLPVDDSTDQKKKIAY